MNKKNLIELQVNDSDITCCTELEISEMKSTNGGSVIGGILLGILIAELLDRNRSKDRADGYNAARKK